MLIQDYMLNTLTDAALLCKIRRSETKKINRYARHAMSSQNVINAVPRQSDLVDME